MQKNKLTGNLRERTRTKKQNKINLTRFAQTFYLTAEEKQKREKL